MSEDANDGPFLFVLLSFLSLFPEGILLEDFVQFVEMPDMMEYAPQNWILPLVKLSLLSAEGDYKESFNKLDNEVSKMLMRGTPKSTIVKHFMEFRSGNQNNILCLRSITVGKKTELIIVVNYLVRQVISESAKQTENLQLIYAGLSNSLRFHRLYLNSLLHYSKQYFNLIEDVHEATQISMSLFTMMDTEDIQEIHSNEFYVPLFQISSKDKTSMKAIFTHYQTSFHIILAESPYLNAVEGLSYTLSSRETVEMPLDEQAEGELVPDYVRYLEDMIMKILTMCKIFDENEILDVIQKAVVKIRDVAQGVNSYTFQWLPFKVTYYEAAQVFKGIQEIPMTNLKKSFIDLMVLIDDLEYKLRDIKPDQHQIHMITYCQLQMYTLKYCFINCEKVRKSDLKPVEYDGTEEHLEKMVVDVYDLMAKDDGLSYLWIEWARACLVLFQYSRDVRIPNSNMNVLELCLHLMQGFEQYGSYGCILKTYLCLIQSSNEEITLKRKLEFIKEGYKLANDRNQEAYRKDFNAEQQRIIEQIEKENAHKITYLQSRPLRHNGDSGIVGMKTDVRKILRNLPDHAVSIKLACDVFREQTYRDLHKIANGCKLLILDLAMKKGDVGLVVEGDDMDRQILTPTQANLIKTLKEDGASVDIVFLLNPSGSSKAKLIAEYLKELKVKIIVYFRKPVDSKKKERAERFDLSHEFFLEQFKKTFLEKFMKLSYKKSSQTQDVSLLIRDCASDTVDFVNHMIHKKKSQVCHYDKAKGCFETKRISDHDLKFTTDCVGIIEPNKSTGTLTCYFGVESKAGIVDSSDKSWDSQESEVVYTNRYKEIVEIYDLVKSSTHSFVQLHGPEGVGKSFLAKQLAYEVGRRKLFAHGVHYVDCERLSFTNELKDLIVQSIDSQSDNILDWFEQNNNCLVILDNFQRVVNGQNVIVPEDLLKGIAATGVKMLLVVDEREECCLNADFVVQTYRVDPLTEDESLRVLATYSVFGESEKERGEKIFFSLGKKGKEIMFALDSFKEVVGYPEKIMQDIEMILCSILNRDFSPAEDRFVANNSFSDLGFSKSVSMSKRHKNIALGNDHDHPYKHALTSSCKSSTGLTISDFDHHLSGCKGFICPCCDEFVHTV